MSITAGVNRREEASFTFQRPEGLVVLHMFLNLPMFAGYSLEIIFPVLRNLSISRIVKNFLFASFCTSRLFWHFVERSIHFLTSSVNMRGYFGKMGKKNMCKTTSPEGRNVYILETGTKCPPSPVPSPPRGRGDGKKGQFVPVCGITAAPASNIVTGGERHLSLSKAPKGRNNFRE